MTYEIEHDGTRLQVAVEGRIDINTAPELEEALTPELDGVDDLFIDLTEVDYISSMGLRLLLVLQKRMDKQGAMRVTGVHDLVAELFDETGFADILTIV